MKEQGRNNPSVEGMFLRGHNKARRELASRFASVQDPALAVNKARKVLALLVAFRPSVPPLPSASPATSADNESLPTSGLHRRAKRKTGTRKNTAGLQVHLTAPRTSSASRLRLSYALPSPFFLLIASGWPYLAVSPAPISLLLPRDERRLISGRQADSFSTWRAIYRAA